MRVNLIGVENLSLAMPAAKGNQAWRQRGRPAMERFAEKCVFDYSTGCVLWTGGTTAGQGNTARYGAFWDGGPWKAHRWAAIHIHGIELGANQAGHNCPAGPNTLCVQHLAGQTIGENVIERNVRVAKKCQQDALTRQFYLFKQLGIGEPEPDQPKIEQVGIPFHTPPAWLRPYIRPKEIDNDDCPF